LAIVRIRNLDSRRLESGTLTYHTPPPVSVVTRSGSSGVLKTCTDVVGNRLSPNPFDLVTKTSYYPRLFGRLVMGSPPVLIREFNNFPLGYRPGPENPETYFPGQFNLAEANNFSIQAMSKTNPSAPNSSLPTFVGELKDLPGLVKGWGRSLIQRAAAGYLTWKWVARPMLSDLDKMMRFYDHVAQRLRWLEQLHQTKSIRTRCELDSGMRVIYGNNPMAIHSEGAVWTARQLSTFKSRTWATVQWKLANRLSIPFNLESRRGLASELVRGMTSYEAISTIWELLPWSWLADWFLGVGQAITAYNNTLPLVPSVCLMRTTSSKTEFVTASLPGWVQPTGLPVLEWERKVRRVVFPLIPLNLSVFTSLVEPGRWSILASLAVLNAGRIDAIAKGPFRR
jgi:hypothetical protein